MKNWTDFQRAAFVLLLVVTLAAVYMAIEMNRSARIEDNQRKAIQEAPCLYAQQKVRELYEYNLEKDGVAHPAIDAAGVLRKGCGPNAKISDYPELAELARDSALRWEAGCRFAQIEARAFYQVNIREDTMLDADTVQSVATRTLRARCGPDAKLEDYPEIFKPIDSGSLVDLNIGAERERAEQLDREREDAQRRERLRLAEQARVDAAREAEQERQKAEEARRKEQLDADRIARETRFQEQFTVASRKRQDELRLEKERKEAEAQRRKQEHLQQVQAWYDLFYSSSIVSFKEALTRFYEAYRKEGASDRLPNVCKELKLKIVSIRKNRSLMNSPDREINLRLHEMLGTFDAMAVACNNGEVTEMRRKLGTAEAAIGRLAESLTRFSLTP